MVIAVVLVKRLETEYSRDINFMNLVWCYICCICMHYYYLQMYTVYVTAYSFETNHCLWLFKSQDEIHPNQLVNGQKCNETSDAC